MCILSGVYRFIQAYDGDPHLAMPTWAVVREELDALAEIPQMIWRSLESKWNTRAYMGDASLEGFGIVHTKASLEESREEARLAFPKSLEDEVAKLGAFEEQDDAEDRARQNLGLPSRRQEQEATAGDRAFLDVFGELSDMGAELAKHTGLRSSSLAPRSGGGMEEMLRPRRQKRVLKEIEAGLYYLIYIKVPFGTWSCARSPSLRGPGRDLRGKAGLKAAHREIVDVASRCWDFVAKLVDACLRAGVGVWLENPKSSLLWLTREAKDLLKRGKVVELDLCALGAPVRRTIRAWTNVEALGNLEAKCPGGEHPHADAEAAMMGEAGHHSRRPRGGGGMPRKFAVRFAEAVKVAVDMKQLKRDGADQKVKEEKGRSWVVALGEAWRELSRWSMVWRGAWGTQEHINVQELRTISLIIRHVARGRDGWDTRTLVFVDNLVALACVRRMRSRAMNLLRLLRRIGSMSMALGIHIAVRWVPTYLNFADGPSHGEGVGIAKQNKSAARRQAGEGEVVARIPTEG
jgi:hypothetical protein